MFEWSDIRPFLAVARSGSTLAASVLVETSQSTVKRRIDALEETLDLKLFERRAQGYVLTDQGRALLEQAEQAERAMLALADSAAAAKRRLSGLIRYTLPNDVADPESLEPAVAFMRRHPGVTVDVIPSDAFLDVAEGEVDVSLRAGPRPTDPRLACRKLGEVVWQCFCSESYRTENGLPASTDAIGEHKFIAVEGQLGQSAPLRHYHGLIGRFATRTSTIPGLLSLIRMGVGIGPLPVTLATDLDLLPVFPAMTEAPSDIWLITRDDLRKTPHIRAFLDFLVAHASVYLARQKHRQAELTATLAGQRGVDRAG